MKEDIFIEKLKRRIAQVSVGPSALRNQGAKGIIEICRVYFENSINLKEFKIQAEAERYKDYLDRNTTNLLNKFPENGKSWGAARKGLNLFFREVVYNFYLSNHLEIPGNIEENNRFLSQLEVPLDRDVAQGLRNQFSQLPKWKSIRSLTAEESEVYQIKANMYAKELKIPRVHLDLIFWRKKI